MSALFGTGELLFSDDVFTDWEGAVLARVRRPRQTWRTMFTSGGKLQVVRADETLLFEMPNVDTGGVDEFRVEAADGIPPASVRKRRKLSPLKLEYTVQDDAGTPLGAVKTNPAWSPVEAEGTSGSPVATARLTGGHSWTVDLRANTSPGWDAVMLAMVIIADEMQGELSGMG
ncbi:hypothetical protein E1264_30420 [Actinomadura sp. KC216]|uniref:hypothetical protein n=1 Tax=Actinomadura sp. KC216 TaxID=2530370 RepID=UPI00104E488B|nr:hypothetical protein [Actinomadura sp. KC216]TDB82951.1 hypothetical protein E1264_30420 [Actinomadura sp. KC216]